jgi:hypothetical protein
METHALRDSGAPFRDVGLRVVGLGVAFLGGVAAFLLIPNPFGVSILTTIVVGSVSALLVRAWWAGLAVPAAIWLGAQVPEFVYAVSHARLEDPVWWYGAVEWALLLFIWLAVPATLGVILGLGALAWQEARRIR